MPDKKSDNNLGLSALTNTNNESIRKYKNIHKANISPQRLYFYMNILEVNFWESFHHLNITYTTYCTRDIQCSSSLRNGVISLKRIVNVFVLLKKMFTLKCANNCHGWYRRENFLLHLFLFNICALFSFCFCFFVN